MSSVADQESQFHVIVFTEQSWYEFKRAGASVAGARRSAWGRGRQIRPGNVLLGYLVNNQGFVGVLRAVGETYLGDEPPIWQTVHLPARVPVELVHELSVD